MRSHEHGATDEETRFFIDLTSSASVNPMEHLNDLTPRALARLARRANRLRKRDIRRFREMAAENGLTGRQLRLLADAWAEGGSAGIAALGPAIDVEEATMVRSEKVIETWRRRHFPLDTLHAETWHNRITVQWMRPGAQPTQPLIRQPLMQLRRTDNARWHLYRHAAQGEWWPVVVRGPRQRQSLSACLDAVRVDALHHFWGVQGPPTDLAVGDAAPWPES